MYGLMTPLPCSTKRQPASATRRPPRLCMDWNTVETTPPHLPEPQKPTPLPPEMPGPLGPIGTPTPTENPVPVREPPVTLPPES